MRYHCKDCGKWVKDKFIFGLLHLCADQSAMPQRGTQAFNNEVARRSGEREFLNLLHRTSEGK